MPGHTRLYRRGATYYHRAVVPKDIIATYGKREETFSLGTKDHAEAARKVRLAAVEVDRRFDEHRRRLKHAEEPALAELTPQQIARAKAAYLHYLLDEDEQVRLDGFSDPMSGEPIPYEPRPTFEEREELVEDMDVVNRFDLTRGRLGVFFWGRSGGGVVVGGHRATAGRELAELAEARTGAAGSLRRGR